jgi:hypothetical protein
MQRRIPGVTAFIHQGLRGFMFLADVSYLNSRRVAFSKMGAKTALSIVNLQHGNLLGVMKQAINQFVDPAVRALVRRGGVVPRLNEVFFFQVAAF